MNEPDDITVAAEFEEFRRSVPTAFPAPPTADVYAEAGSRRGRRRTATSVVAGVSVLAAVATGVSLRMTTEARQPPHPGTTPSAVPSVTPSAAPSATPKVTPPAVTNLAVPRDVGNKVRFLDSTTADRVRRMTVTLPAWPDARVAKPCPAGRFTFQDGQALTGATDGSGEYAYPWTYAVLFKGGRGVFANVDGEPGDEIVLPIGCGPIEYRFRLLVLKPAGGQLRALGFVADFEAMPEFGRYYPQDGDLVVEVGEHPLDQGALQRRRYHWQGSRFVQVGGPTSFPPVTDIRTVDLRNGSLWVDLTRQPGSSNNFSQTLSFVDGVGGMWPYDGEEFIHPGADFLVGAVSPGFLTEPADAGAGTADTLVTLTCRWDDGGVDQFVYRASTVGNTSLAVRTGVDGVTGIVSHRIVNGLAEVVVTTAAGQETRRYRSNGYGFTRVG